tara:strand:+ start:452 stop:739 length:288 start_codon:yes stop_codon:yes gene_type:complete
MMLGAVEVDFFDLFYGTEIRRRHTEKFLAGFDRLPELAKGCDTDNIILATLITSANGYLNVKMRDLHPDIKFEQTVGNDSVEYMDRITNTRIKSS